MSQNLQGVGANLARIQSVIGINAIPFGFGKRINVCAIDQLKQILFGGRKWP